MILKVNFKNQEWFKSVCDCCHADCVDEEGDKCLMPDELSAKNLSMEEGWQNDKDGRQYCPDCIIPEGVPRRARIELFTPAEKAIYEAMQKIEEMPADVRLTDAVVLLQEAQNKVADFVDGK